MNCPATPRQYATGSPISPPPSTPRPCVFASRPPSAICQPQISPTSSSASLTSRLAPTVHEIGSAYGADRRAIRPSRGASSPTVSGVGGLWTCL
ncbi:hypothetical protein GUJ93_ZPchr0002g23311 [Zizania palustris]|uniref:Uncharacterized protein n=1 Tax=Zizania palustris TaxID=103762 RepID=A0A8J5SPZ6_ZIZPA|nr:hypothetical protein GUJ93_ZPchr0002g23311 [Zizania palustris]